MILSVSLHKKNGSGSLSYPCIFAYMNGADEETYKKVFKAIDKVLDGSLNIETAHVDFEQSSANSLKTVFPNIAIRRCWFHCLQSWRRRLLKEQLHEYTRGLV